MTGRRRWAAGALVVAAMAFPLVAAACRGGSDAGFKLRGADGATGADYRYSIPAGAGQAAIDGTPIEVVPAELDVHVGDVIEIVNGDDRGHLVGPFFVGAGETMRQEFASPGEFQGVCSVHPSGQIVIKVT